jgi:hypothetical protein
LDWDDCILFTIYIVVSSSSPSYQPNRAMLALFRI